ncbi:MAG TPA: hypothetical protein VJT73_01240 [Polyangiaceae bacterium]|nr:hypothetical protein [Polyangiaceae bacterium]
MRILIRHDAKGHIVSALKASVLDPGVTEPFGPLEEGEGFIEVDPTPELEALECHDFPERFVVDPQKRKLKAVASTASAPKTAPDEPADKPPAKRPKKGGE